MALDAPSVPALALASDSGTKGDNVTNVIAPLITGSGEAGAAVTLFDGSTKVGSATVAAGGTWSVVTAPLAGGVHSITAVQTEEGRTSSPSAALALTIDNIPPAAPLGVLLTQVSDSGKQGDNLTNKSKPIFSGTGEVGATVTLRDGGTPIGTGIVGGTGIWFITAATSLAAGVNHITATQTDVAGNTSVPSSALDITLDTIVPPPVTLALGSTSDSGPIGDNITNVVLPTFTGTGEDGAIVTLSDAGITIGTGKVAGGVWSMAATALLTEGHNPIIATQTDPAGNVSTPSATLDVVLDTRIPARPGALLLTSASDSGTKGDNVTNISTPTITGTGERGATVTLREGATIIGTATVIGGPVGVWSIDFTTTPLTEGTHTFTATQTGATGNISPASAALVVTLDTTAQPPAALTLTPASDSGFGGDNITNVTRPTIRGTGENGATVTLVEGQTTIGTATVVGGTWSIAASTALAEGGHSLIAKQVDVAGNSSPASAVLNVVVDTTAPPAPGTPDLADASDSGASNSDNITNIALPTFNGTGVDGATVTLLDGTTTIGTGTVNGGKWSIAATTALVVGSNAITATQTDAAGNTSAASAALVVTRDTSGLPPAALALTPDTDSGTKGDNVTKFTTPAISGTGDVGAIVTLHDGGATLGIGPVDAAGIWTITTDALTGGVHHITADQTKAGVISDTSATLTLTIDAIPPAAPAALLLTQVSDSGRQGDNLTNKNKPIFSGTGEIGVTVTLRDDNATIGTGIVSGTGTWFVTATAPLSNGVNPITASQTDLAGNISVDSEVLDVTLDTVVLPPAGPDLMPASDSGTKGDNITNVRLPGFTGSGEDGATVTLSDAGFIIGTGKVALGVWSIATTTTLNEGNNAIIATQTDLAGNISTPSAVLNVTLDTRVPAHPGTLQLTPASDSGAKGDNVSNIITPTISGTGERGATVTLREGGAIFGTATVIGGPVGVWSIAAKTALAEGAHTFIATQTGVTGNISLPSTALNFVVDTVAPSAPTIVDIGGPDHEVSSQLGDARVSGTAEANSTIALKSGASELGTAVTDGSGNWSYTLSAANITALGQGAGKTVTATASDVAGNQSDAAAPFNFGVDTVVLAPGSLTLEPAGDSGANGDMITNVPNPTISGTGEEGATVTLLDGSTTLGTGQVAGGVWSINATKALTEGANAITAKQTDTAGNISDASATLLVTLDRTAPAAPSAPDLAAASDSGSSDTDSITNIGKPTISGTGETGATVTLLDGNATIGSGTVAGGTWSITATKALTEGTNAITARQTDTAGNISIPSTTLTVTLDTTVPAAPSAPDLAPVSDSGASNTDNMTNVALPIFSGTGAERATVTLLDGSTMIGTGTVKGGAWSIAAVTTLADGSNAISAKQTDAAGNVSTSSAALNVTLDVTPPLVTAVTASPADASLGAGALVTLTLGVSETALVAGGTPTLMLNNGGIATFVSGSGTSALLFNYTVAGGADVPDLAITGVSLNGATVTDQAGNAADLTGAAVNPAGTLAIEPTGIAAFDTTTKQSVAVAGQAYTGPVAGLENEYINLTSDNLNVSTVTPGWFIHSGSGDDAIAVSSGTNVLDGGPGSNFLTGGSGADTFFVDDRAAPADTCSTVNKFQAGDAATIWGVTPQDFGLTWVDGQGAAGFTGLTLHATAPGRPTASLTLAGYSQADLGNGRLSVVFGTDQASGSAFMFVHGNG